MTADRAICSQRAAFLPFAWWRNTCAFGVALPFGCRVGGVVAGSGDAVATVAGGSDIVVVSKVGMRFGIKCFEYVATRGVNVDMDAFRLGDVHPFHLLIIHQVFNTACNKCSVVFQYDGFTLG